MSCSTISAPFGFLFSSISPILLSYLGLCRCICTIYIGEGSLAGRYVHVLRETVEDSCRCPGLAFFREINFNYTLTLPTHALFLILVRVYTRRTKIYIVLPVSCSSPTEVPFIPRIFPTRVLTFSCSFRCRVKQERSRKKKKRENDL